MTQGSCWFSLLSPLVSVVADQFYVSEEEFSKIISSTDDIFMWETEKLIFGRQRESKNKLPWVCPKCIKLLEMKKISRTKIKEFYLSVANFVSVSQKNSVHGCHRSINEQRCFGSSEKLQAWEQRTKEGAEN